jgi:methylmalonyl-CoA mutase, C-terminal domain
MRKIRVLVGKPGLDGHDRGAKVVAAALRDAGMEVIYTGLHQTPEQIVEAAIQEDVDVVALSVLSGAHMTLFPEVLKLMRRHGIEDRLLSGGGIIPAEDMEKLSGMGVGRLFGPGASTQDIAAYIRDWFSGHMGASPGKARPATPAAKRVPRRGARAAPAAAVSAPAPASRTARAPVARPAAKSAARASSRRRGNGAARERTAARRISKSGTRSRAAGTRKTRSSARSGRARRSGTRS